MTEATHGQEDQYMLLADDDQEDIEILTAAIYKIDTKIRIVRFSNGRQVFKFLEEITPNSLLPAVIILDFNMPEWNGFKALDEIKRDPRYKDIPVFILSDSLNLEIKTLSKTKGAAGFINKTSEPVKLTQVAVTFNAYRFFPPRFKRKA